MDDPNALPRLYAQMDSIEIDGKFYALGDEIDRDKHEPGTLGYLMGLGHVGATKPGTPTTIETRAPVEGMTRSALLAELGDGMADDDLRAAVMRRRDADPLDDDDDEEEDDEDQKLLKLSIPKLTEQLDSINDLDRLNSLRAAEAAKTKPRDGAIAAIADRIEELNAAEKARATKAAYEDGGLKDIDLATASADQLRIIAEHEGATIPEGDPSDEDLRAAIVAKRAA